MATKTAPLDLVEATASGDTTATLIALRDLLARTIADTGSAREIASLTRQFVDVLGELDGRKPAKPTKQSPMDELAEIRKARGNTGPRIKPRQMDDHGNTAVDKG
ncbi:hypothetical protein AB0362_00025 [Rhodococcus sp. NPDC079359]|uniref:hypothetical protein n=1 Tax=Rhodococcus sp. NPDC079359 TaxID=3154961 RepID=UPI00344F0E80